MAGTFSRSWQLVKESWSVLSKDKELLVFPLVSGIAVVLIIASFILPLLFSGLLGSIVGPVAWIMLLFVFYFLTYFVVIFFNTALIAAAYIRLTGGDPTIRDGLSHAGGHLGQIAAWALISATVGLVLSALRNRGGVAGSVASGILGTAWSLVTFFVIPVMIFEEKGVIDAIKESMGLFKRTWGENIVGSIGLGLVWIPAILVLFVTIWTAIAASAFIIPMAALFVLVLAVTGVLYSALRGIFTAALYGYAKTGKVPEAFSGELITGAFRPKGGNI
ncbi:membrane-associated HD superfamily phosphohydrolase [Methanolinea mesophila]|uniref:DUF6159 family protein n=1 Tax=Methanolinea mesophila TaxID=547055 RepID=UPI001AE4F433|nr:DUF6159 family protein [Methanolinea mesophila]MBP1929804.1 membrane-associated HD superfamily phosphohydrolase [Methanolinea mesophila]